MWGSGVSGVTATALGTSATGLPPAHQGQGLATELSIAAHHAATIIDPSVAFIAWVDEHNAASRRVAERISLTNQGPRADPSDGEIRLAYSDRRLD